MVDHYTEKILYMPDVCLVNNYKQDPHALRVLAEDHEHMDKAIFLIATYTISLRTNLSLPISDKCTKSNLKFLLYG